MKKIIVIGCPGAGKSTFARKLRDAFELPLFYIDMMWHRADRTTISRDELDAELLRITSLDKWIIDGNYLRSMELRMSRCDTVFFLDYSVDTCLSGAMERVGHAREDMPWVENCFDDEMRKLITRFPTDQRPVIYELLKKYNEKLNVYIFHSRDEAEAFLQ